MTVGTSDLQADLDAATRPRSQLASSISEKAKFWMKNDQRGYRFVGWPRGLALQRVSFFLKG